MSITVASLITNFDTYLGDTSNDRVTAAERLQYLTEATVWLQEELQNDLQNQTYTLNYYDTVYRYKVTSAIADLLEGADLRRSETDQAESFTHKSARELAEEIGQDFPESSWAVERYDSNNYLLVNHESKYQAKLICGFESTTEGGGTWAVDATNSDATNLTVDTVEFKNGTASFNFDADVSQSGNNKLEIYNDDLDSLDLSEYVDLAAWIVWVYIPDVTYFSSVTMYWGSTTSAYWSVTATTDITGAAFVTGWNRVKVNWADATMTSTPDETAITYFQIDLNYTGSQTDDTDFRLDQLILVRPEVLTFHYIGWYVGTDTLGTTQRTAFTATTDIPYFSGLYDQYKYPVSHKAVSLAFRNLRLRNEADQEELEAVRTLQRAKGIIPSSKNPELKSFKIRGNNLTRHRRRGR